MFEVFDIENAESLFHLLEERLQKYIEDPVKDTGDIILIIMMANHLREWIAPDFDPKCKAKTAEQKFSKSIYNDLSFGVIRAVCNGTKHATKLSGAVTKFGTTMSEWPTLAAVRTLAKGAPIAHLVDGAPIENHIEIVMEKYRVWFHEKKNPS